MRHKPRHIITMASAIIAAFTMIYFSLTFHLTKAESSSCQWEISNQFCDLPNSFGGSGTCGGIPPTGTPSSSSDTCYMGTYNQQDYYNFQGWCNANEVWVYFYQGSVGCDIPTVNGSCGSTANTCNTGTSANYNAGSCGGNATWTCNGSGGGSNASCSVANGACGYNCESGNLNPSLNITTNNGVAGAALDAGARLYSSIWGGSGVGGCFRNTSSNNYFIPTKTQAERNSFQNNLPTGVTKANGTW